MKTLIFLFPKEDREESKEGSLNIYQVQHVTQRSLRHLEPQDLVAATFRTSSFISTGLLIETNTFWKAHPVQVEQEDGEHGHSGAEGPAQHSQTQDEEELRPRPQSPAVPGDGRSANTKPNS